VKRIRIIAEYLGAFLLILILLVLIGSTVVVKYYGDDLQEYTMEMINDQLDTKISIDEMGFSLLRNFPHISVMFNDVVVWSGHNFNRNEFSRYEADTLMVTERIYVEFNIIKLLRKKYTVRSFEAKNGSIKLYIDSSGKGNFLIAKERTGQGDSPLIELNGVVVRGINVEYINLATEMEIRGRLKDVLFSGNFNKDNYMMKVLGEMYIDRTSSAGITYIAGQDVKTDVALKVSGKQYTVSKGNIELGKLSASLEGEFVVDPLAGTDLDLQFTGKRIDLGLLTDIMADKVKEVENIRTRGEMDLFVHLSGLATSTYSPHIDASFNASRCYINIPDYSLELFDINLEGSFTNGVSNSPQSSAIQIHQISTSTNKSVLKGNIELTNFVEPVFDASVNGDFDGRELASYLKDLPVVVSRGQILTNFKVSGSYKPEKDGPGKLRIKPSGFVDMNDLRIQLVSPAINGDSINGRISINENQLACDLKCLIENSHFKADLIATNPFFSQEKEVLKIKGEIESSGVNIDDLSAAFSKNNNTGEKAPFSFPNDIMLDIDFNIDKIIKGDIETRRLNGNLTYRYPGIFLEPIYLETMHGAINAKISMTDLNKPVRLAAINANYRNVEIGDLFISFNNFGQTFLTDKNIAGKISGETALFAPLREDFSPITEQIVSENTFVIEQGELNNFKPMIELSRFLKIDKMDHISFSTISNTILINNNRIQIPEMEINSSVMTLMASGYHGFDKTFDYHIATQLSEILFNKAKSSRNKEFEIALDKDDHRTLFLHLYDEGEGMMIEFDEDQVMKKIRNDLKEQKTEIKSVLNDEFGLFKKDQDVQQSSQKKNEPEFRFEFPDEEVKDSVSTQPEEKQRWWKKNKKTAKDPEFEFVIDDSTN